MSRYSTKFFSLLSLSDEELAEMSIPNLNNAISSQKLSKDDITKIRERRQRIKNRYNKQKQRRILKDLTEERLLLLFAKSELTNEINFYKSATRNQNCILDYYVSSNITQLDYCGLSSIPLPLPDYYLSSNIPQSDFIIGQCPYV